MQSTACDTGFENPSGIVTLNMFFWLTLYLQAFYSGDEIERPVLRSLSLAFCTIAGLSFMLLLGWSRVALGSNSYNDVVFGLTLGLVLAFIGNSWWYPFVLSLGERRIVPAESGSDAYYHVSFFDMFMLLVFGIGLPLFFTLAILQSHNGEIDWEFKKEAIWQKIWLGNGCTIDTKNPAEILQFKHFLHAGVFIAGFGSFAG